MEVIGPLRFEFAPQQSIRIVCAGDLHWASEESAHDLWFQMFEENPDAYYIFTGDLLHSISVHDNRFPTSPIDEKFLTFKSLQELVMEEVEDFVTAMRNRLGADWISKHIIGAVSGNHPLYFMRKGFGFNPHRLMCEKLGIRDLGYSCMIHCICRIPEWHFTRSFNIFVHHGFGKGSRTEGGNITSLSRHAMQYDARVFVYGHVHELDVKNLPPRICIRTSARPLYYVAESRLLILSGTFQKCLSRSALPTYFELKGFPVRPLGYAYFDLLFEIRREKRTMYRELRIDGGTRCFN